VRVYRHKGRQHSEQVPNVGASHILAICLYLEHVQPDPALHVLLSLVADRDSRRNFMDPALHLLLGLAPECDSRRNGIGIHHGVATSSDLLWLEIQAMKE